MNTMVAYNSSSRLAAFKIQAQDLRVMSKKIDQLQARTLGVYSLDTPRASHQSPTGRWSQGYPIWYKLHRRTSTPKENLFQSSIKDGNRAHRKPLKLCVYHILCRIIVHWEWISPQAAGACVHRMCPPILWGWWLMVDGWWFMVRCIEIIQYPVSTYDNRTR